jgi:hypothetical protein
VCSCTISGLGEKRANLHICVGFVSSGSVQPSLLGASISHTRMRIAFSACLCYRIQMLNEVQHLPPISHAENSNATWSPISQPVFPNDLPAAAFVVAASRKILPLTEQVPPETNPTHATAKNQVDEGLISEIKWTLTSTSRTETPPILATCWRV